MEPFVALMRRYVVDYTNRHDVSVCPQIMETGYTLHMGPHVLRGRDDSYIPAAQAQFRQFPGLVLTVHDLVTNGKYLAMRFSEHGASVKHAGARAAWTGIGIYRWNNRKLVENYVEQDYLARQRQLAGAPTHVVEAPAVAPWDTVAHESDPSAEKVVRSWIADGLPGASVRWDDGSLGVRQRIRETSIDLLFSAGDQVAFRLRRSGEFLGGCPEASDAIEIGTPTTLHLVGLVRVSDGAVADGQIVSDRLGFIRAANPHPVS